MEILVKPIVTEKLTKQADTLNRYGFVVDNRANKLQIKKAIEEMYSVSIADINTMIRGGKAKRRMTKTGIQNGKMNTVKRAIVTLAQGEKIDFYSNI